MYIHLDFLRFFIFDFFGVRDCDLDDLRRSRERDLPRLSLDLDRDLELDLTRSRKFFFCFLLFLFFRLFFLTSTDHDPDLASLSSFDLERLK